MVKIAIIGSGFGTYGLLPAFSHTANCQVVALCAHSSERVRTAITRYKVLHLLHDWRAVFEKVEFDAIAIAVTPPIQFEIAHLALQQGKAVFAEKPLAANLAQARKLRELALAQGCTTAIDFIFPEIDAWQQLKAALSDNLIGQPIRYTLIWNFLSADIKKHQLTWKSNPDLGGGAVAYYFSHLLHVLENLFGHMTITNSQIRYADARTKTVELAVDLSTQHQSGVAGKTHFQSDAQTDLKHELIIQGTHGSLALISRTGVTTNFKLTVTKAGQTTELPVTDLIAQQDEDERVPVIQKLCQRFIDACRSQASMSPSFEHGFRVQELIDDIRHQATIINE